MTHNLSQPHRNHSYVTSREASAAGRLRSSRLIVTDLLVRAKVPMGTESCLRGLRLIKYGPNHAYFKKIQSQALGGAETGFYAHEILGT